MTEQSFLNPPLPNDRPNDLDTSDKPAVQAPQLAGLKAELPYTAFTLPTMVVFEAQEPDEPPDLNRPPDVNGQLGGGPVMPPIPQGGPLFRNVDQPGYWQSRMSTPAVAETIRLIGTLGEDYLKILKEDGNSPLRTNSLLKFMNCTTDNQRKQAIEDLYSTFKKPAACLAPDLAEDALSDPREAHRRAAFRFMITSDAKIRIDRIFAEKAQAGKPLDKADNEAIKEIVKDLLKYEREITGTFEEFLAGYDKGGLRVNVGADERFGLPAGAASIRELADRETTKNIVIALEKATAGGGNEVTPVKVAESLEQLTALAKQKPPSTAAVEMLNRLSGAGVDVPDLLKDLKSADEEIVRAAVARFKDVLPEMKYGGFNPAEICKSIPPDMLRKIVKDEEKRALKEYTQLTQPLVEFCAGGADRQKSIARAEAASKQLDVGADVVAWMKFADLQLRLKDAKSADEAVHILRATKHLVDTERNPYAAQYLSNLPFAARDIQAKLKLEKDPLEVLASGGADAQKVLAELQQGMSGLTAEVAEKGARGVLADMLPDETPDLIEKRIARLEQFAKDSPFARDRYQFLQVESLARRMRDDAGDATKMSQHMDKLVQLSTQGNLYARTLACELLIDKPHTDRLNENAADDAPYLVPSYKLKLEECLKNNPDQVKALRQKLADAMCSQDLQTLPPRQQAILHTLSSFTEKELQSSFTDTSIGKRLAEKLRQTASEADPKNLPAIAAGVVRYMQVRNEAHPAKIADIYLQCVERGGVTRDKLSEQYDTMMALARNQKNAESVRVIAGLTFNPTAQGFKPPPAELLRTLYAAQPMGLVEHPFKTHIKEAVKEYSERAVLAQEAEYPKFLLQAAAALRNGQEPPKNDLSKTLIQQHKVMSDLYAGLKLTDQRDYHQAQAAEIQRVETALKAAEGKANGASGDIVKTLVEEILAVASKVSVEANRSSFKAEVGDRFMLDCLEKLKGVRLPLALRELAASFKGFELKEGNFRFTGKASVDIRAHDMNVPFLGVDRVVQLKLENTGGKINVDPKLDKVVIDNLTGLTLTLDQSAGALIKAKLADLPPDKRQSAAFLASLIENGLKPSLAAKSIELELEPQPNGDAILCMKLKLGMANNEFDITEKIALPKEDADKLREFMAEQRKPADQQNPADFLKKFVSLGLDDKFNEFLKKFDSFEKTADGGFKCTRSEPAKFDLGNLKLLVDKTLIAKPMRTQDASVITGIEGLSAKLPIPDALAEKLGIKDPVNIKELRVGDLINGRRKITIETDSIYKRVEIELDSEFKLVKDAEGNIAVNVLVSKNGEELKVGMRFNPDSMQAGKILDSTWSFELQGSADLKEQLLGGFLKELSPLARNIEKFNNTPRATTIKLSDETTIDVKGAQLKFDRQIILSRPGGVNRDGGFTADVSGITVTKFGDSRLYRFVYGGKPLLKPDKLEWRPGGGAEGDLTIVPSKNSAITKASFKIDKDTFKPNSGSITIDNPLEAATSIGSTTWTSITADLKAKNGGDLEIDNWAELIASLTAKTILVNATRPVRLIGMAAKAIWSFFAD